MPLLPTWETWVHLLVPACPNSDDGRNLGNEPADKDTFFLSLPLSLSIFLPPSLSLLPFPQLTLLLLFQINNKILIKKDSVPSVKKLMIVYKGFFVGAKWLFLRGCEENLYMFPRHWAHTLLVVEGAPRFLKPFLPLFCLFLGL